MAIVITSNVPSLIAQNHLSETSRVLNKSIAKLASGKRIVSAEDDPAGLAISNRFESAARSLLVAQRNSNDGLSMLQVAEGGLQEIGSILVRMRELTIQAANGTLSNSDRSFLNTELIELKNEIARISTSTKYNGNNILDGTYSTIGLEIQVGISGSTSDRMTINIISATTSALGSVGELTISQLTISESAGHAKTMIKYLDAAIDDISLTRSNIGAKLSRLNSTIRSISVSYMNLVGANSRILDVDVAEETSQIMRSQILVQAGVSVLSQANSAPQIALGLLG